jgi:hypothetical protein
MLTAQQASLAGAVLDLRWQPELEKCRHPAPAPPPFWQSAHVRAVSAVPELTSDIFVNENENEKDFKNENGIRTVMILFKRTKMIASPRGPKAAKSNVIRTITLRRLAAALLRCYHYAASGNDY